MSHKQYLGHFNINLLNSNSNTLCLINFVFISMPDSFRCVISIHHTIDLFSLFIGYLANAYLSSKLYKQFCTETSVSWKEYNTGFKHKCTGWNEERQWKLVFIVVYWAPSTVVVPIVLYKMTAFVLVVAILVVVCCWYSTHTKCIQDQSTRSICTKQELFSTWHALHLRRDENKPYSFTALSWVHVDQLLQQVLHKWWAWQKCVTFVCICTYVCTCMSHTNLVHTSYVDVHVCVWWQCKLSC